MYIEESYETGKDAFESLSLGNVLKKRMVAKKLKAIEKVLSRNPTKYATADDFTSIFTCLPQMPFRKSIKIGQVKDTDTVCVWSDCYFLQKESVLQVTEECEKAGIKLRWFFKKYTKKIKRVQVYREKT